MTAVPPELLQHAPLVVATFLVAAWIVAVLVPHVARYAIRIGAVARGGSAHGNGQRVHQGATPNIGGVAIFAGFLAAVAVGAIVAPEALLGYRRELLAILLGGTLMMIVGLIDDLVQIAPTLRLLAQVVAALLLVLNGVTIDFVTDYFGAGQLLFLPQAIAALLTLVWVVGFVNAFNFIDGLDGLSSGIAAIAALSLLAIALQFPDRGASLLILAAVAGSALGFLRHNAKPAAIHMGDSGAYLLGYLLAATSVMGALKVGAAVTVLTPILVLALPVVNLTQVTLRRLRRGQSPMIAANDHLHDLLRVRSGSVRLAVYTLWAAALTCAALGMWLSATPLGLAVGTLGASVALLVVVTLLRGRDARLQPLASERA
jgi:UDP-GlcNAc:undecaprenyl-phosphate/decaprenyl-phosphate GlcNAc-1-phosphate transferase